MVVPVLSIFPEGGAPSPVLTTSYQKPRCLYLSAFFIWTLIAAGRYFLAFLDRRVLLIWGVVDTCLLCLVTANLVIKNCYSHHRARYLNRMDRKPNMEAKEITHCLAILHYKEPEHQLFQLVEELAQQPAAGKKVLIVGMERKTPDQDKKLAEIQAKGGDAFDQVLYTVHDLLPGEIPGTGSNHFATQVAAELHFEDKTNVIFSKFDCNMRLSGNLLEEIEAVWCSVDAPRRKGITFMPNVFWSADIPDKDRSAMEITCSLGMSVSANMAPFSISFVSGSLLGAIEVGYTPPALLGEDELMFTKKVALIPHASTYRLSASIMKIFYPPHLGSHEFVASVFLPKLVRWFVGWIEVHGYLLSWIFGRVPNHPRVQCPLKSIGLFLLTTIRLYVSFVILFSAIPMAEIYMLCGRAKYPDDQANEMVEQLLRLQTRVFFISFTLTLFSAARIHHRVYSSFDCLQFHPKALISYPLGFFVFMALPLPIWWNYFKHGILNKPVVHTAQTDHVRTAVQKGGEPATSTPEAAADDDVAAGARHDSV